MGASLIHPFRADLWGIIGFPGGKIVGGNEKTTAVLSIRSRWPLTAFAVPIYPNDKPLAPLQRPGKLRESMVDWN